MGAENEQWQDESAGEYLSRKYREQSDFIEEIPGSDDPPYVWLCDGLTRIYKDKNGKLYKNNGLGACDQNDDREIIYSHKAEPFEFVKYEITGCGHGTPKEDIELFTKRK